MPVRATASFGVDPRSPSRARDLVRTAIEPVARPREVDAVVLAVSELATNAVTHAGTQFEVAVEVRGEVVRVEVTDGDEHDPEPAEPAPVDLGGRGLLLVERVADRWGVEHRHGGKTVWFERAVHAPAGGGNGSDGS